MSLPRQSKSERLAILIEVRARMPQPVVFATDLAKTSASELQLHPREVEKFICNLSDSDKSKLRLYIFGGVSDALLDVFRNTRARMSQTVVPQMALAIEVAPQLNLSPKWTLTLLRRLSWSQKFELKYGFVGEKGEDYWKNIWVLRKAAKMLDISRRRIKEMRLAETAAPMAGLTPHELYDFIVSDVPPPHRVGLKLRCARIAPLRRSR